MIQIKPVSDLINAVEKAILERLPVCESFELYLGTFCSIDVIEKI